MLSLDIYDTNIFMWFGGIALLGDPPKTNLLNDLIFGASVFLILAVDILEMNILT